MIGMVLGTYRDREGGADGSIAADWVQRKGWVERSTNETRRTGWLVGPSARARTRGENKAHSWIGGMVRVRSTFLYDCRSILSYLMSHDMVPEDIACHVMPCHVMSRSIFADEYDGWINGIWG